MDNKSFILKTAVFIVCIGIVNYRHLAYSRKNKEQNDVFKYIRECFQVVISMIYIMSSVI